MRRRLRCRVRWTTREVELHGQTIPSDSKVLLITGSAGRDERTFPDADRFDIHREWTTTCPSVMASTSVSALPWPASRAAIALEETLRRFPEWSVDLEQAVPLHTSTVRGYTQLPITV